VRVGIILAFAVLGAVSAIYMVCRTCCRRNTQNQYEIADQMDPDELKLQQILDNSPMNFFDDVGEGDIEMTANGIARQDYSNGMDAEKLSDDEHDLGSDAELDYDEELNEDVTKLTGELDDDDDGVDDVDLNTDLTDVN